MRNSFFQNAVRVLLGTFLVQSPLSAAENLWTGAGGDNLWTNVSNWSLGILPDATQDVLIAPGNTNPVVLNGSADVGSLVLGTTQSVAVLTIAGGVLDCHTGGRVESGAVLIVTGGLNTEGGFRVEGTVHWLGSGPLLVATGSAFTNGGLFLIETNCTLGDPSNMGSFVNEGTMEAAAGTGMVTLRNYLLFTSTGTLRAETNAVLNVEPDNPFFPLVLADGSVFDGPGVVRLSSFFYSRQDGLMTVKGTLEYQATQLTGASRWTGSGLFKWQGGQLSDFTFLAGFHAEIQNGAVATGVCTNQGNIRCATNSSFVNGNGIGISLPCLFHNLGSFEIQTNFAFAISEGCFNNEGTLQVPSNCGPVTLTIDGRFTNSATIRVETNSVLAIRADTPSCYFVDGTVFDGDGLIRIVQTTAQMVWAGAITVNATVELEGNPNALPFQSSSRWSGSGLLRWLAGTLTQFTFEPGFHVEVGGSDAKQIFGACTNQGTVRWTGNANLNPFFSDSFNNQGLFRIEADGTWDASIPFNNEPGGTLQQIAGQFSLGSLTNRGTLNLEKGGLNLVSDLACGGVGSYQIVLSGYSPLTDFNQLNAVNLALDGSLVVTLTNSFIPTNGSSFTFATDTTQTGQFASVSLPTLPSNLTWKVQYLPDAVVLQVIQPVTLGAPMVLVNGDFQFTLGGPPAGAYEIQASSNLVDWITIATNRPFSGVLTVTDTNALHFSRRFYRGRIFE